MASCCLVKNMNDKDSLASCRVCGSKGKKIKRITMEHLLKDEHVSEIEEGQYHFCETPQCDVIYFNNESNSYFRKETLKVRVGIKQTDDPIPLCYCFGHTEKSARDEIEEGFSTVIESIKAKVKAGDCACEIKNPSGNCCLGTVTRAVQRALALRVSNGMADGLKPAEVPAHDCCALESESIKTQEI